MNLDEYFGIGVTITLGAHRFEPDEIKAFAARYDPQPFHLDEKAAEKSVFGGLCASGWHTASMWMKYNLAKRQDAEPRRWTRSRPFAPSDRPDRHSGRSVVTPLTPFGCGTAQDCRHLPAIRTAPCLLRSAAWTVSGFAARAKSKR